MGAGRRARRGRQTVGAAAGGGAGRGRARLAGGGATGGGRRAARARGGADGGAARRGSGGRGLSGPGGGAGRRRGRAGGPRAGGDVAVGAGHGLVDLRGIAGDHRQRLGDQLEASGADPRARGAGLGQARQGPGEEMRQALGQRRLAVMRLGRRHDHLEPQTGAQEGRQPPPAPAPDRAEHDLPPRQPVARAGRTEHRVAGEDLDPLGQRRTHQAGRLLLDRADVDHELARAQAGGERGQRP